MWCKQKRKQWKGFLKSKYHNLTLFQKMIFFYVLLLCMPMVLIGAVSLGNIRGKLDDEYKNSKEEVLLEKKNSIIDHAAWISFCIDSFQYNSKLVEYVENYDFSTADGVDVWMTSVKPAFQQVKAANTYLSDIKIWRMYDKEKNDPRYVQNASDNPDLDKIGKMGYKTLKLFIKEGEPIQNCQIYGGLFNAKGFHKVGYVEVDCKLDFLLSQLDFVKEGEVLYLTHQETVYRVMQDAKNGLYLEVCQEGLPETVNRITVAVDELDLLLDYDYGKLQIWSDTTMITVVVCVILMFLFFSMVYYSFYRSITRRLTALSDHMMYKTTNYMQLYPVDPNKDEIGSLVKVYNKMVTKINALNDEILQKERLANQAQYYAMQSQIQPHFLYNTLENIDMLIEIGENEKASKMIELFGKILRYNLSRRRETASLKDEIRHVEKYLQLYSYRMRDDFEWTVDMDPSCNDVLCPYCMMQPVVENCFKHGFSNVDRGLWIRIRVYRKDGYVLVEITDNGKGMKKERLQEVNRQLDGREKPQSEETSVGLINVQERILLMCKEGSGLQVFWQEQGCRVVIAIKI